MEELLRDFIGWMEALPSIGIYVVVLVVAYGENVVPPLPGDLVVVFGGYLAGMGLVSLPVIIVLASVGAALGFMTVYAVGYRVGEAIFDRGYMGALPLGELDRARRWVLRWGYYIVLGNRFLSGIRAVIALAVGIAEMEARRTLLCAVISAVAWCTLIGYAGYAFGSNWDVVIRYLRRYGELVLVLIGLVLVVQVGRWFYARRDDER